ncbi:MAG: hypothetical protein PHY54_13430 [Methylococcales bacterium]|nr:hypothetical protein [Methylococcales bacterium]
MTQNNNQATEEQTTGMQSTVIMDITALNEHRADQIALAEKFVDAMTPGAVVEFEPEEAEQAGAFFEDALDEEDAFASVIDNDMEEHG